MILTPSRRSSRGPARHDVDSRVERLGVAGAGDLLERAKAQLRVAVALHRRQQEPPAELALTVEVQHRLRPSPSVRRHARSRECGPHVLLAVVEVLHRDPPQLPLEHLRPPLWIRRDGKHPALDPNPAATPAAHGADDDRPAAVDVAIQQRVQRHDRVVVLGGGVHEVR